MADVDVDQFGEHDKTDSHPNEENMPLPPVTPGEGSLGNLNMNKQCHLEEGKLKKKGSLILMLTVCTRSYVSIIDKHQMQSIMITLDVRVRSFTSKARTSHSQMRMES